MMLELIEPVGGSPGYGELLVIALLRVDASSWVAMFVPVVEGYEGWRFRDDARKTASAWWHR